MRCVARSEPWITWAKSSGACEAAVGRFYSQDLEPRPHPHDRRCDQCLLGVPAFQPRSGHYSKCPVTCRSQMSRDIPRCFLPSSAQTTAPRAQYAQTDPHTHTHSHGCSSTESSHGLVDSALRVPRVQLGKQSTGRHLANTLAP